MRGSCRRPHQQPELWRDYDVAIEHWRQKGIMVDGIWPRQIAQIDAALDGWLAGKAKPDDLFWTIWGYHLLPDIYHQAILEDPYGVIAGWQARLQSYPPQLKKAILDQHVASLRYWRTDYHYQSKVRRGDIVFLAGLSARLVHDMMQVLFRAQRNVFRGRRPEPAVRRPVQDRAGTVCREGTSCLVPIGRHRCAPGAVRRPGRPQRRGHHISGTAWLIRAPVA